MTTIEVSVALTWVALAGLVFKYFFDSGKIKNRMSRLKTLKTEIGSLSAASASSETKLKKKMQGLEEDQKSFVRALEEKQEKALKDLDESQAKVLTSFETRMLKDSAEMNSHLRDKIAEYGVQIAELNFKIRELEEKYQLNAMELQDVEYSLEELKEVFRAYYDFLTEFTEEFGLDNSKIYQELMGRTKAIYDLVEEVVGRIHGGTNEKNGVRTVATIGSLKTGQA